MRRRRLFPVCCVFTAALTACQLVSGEDCLSLRGPAIVVRITDAPSGTVPTSGVTLVIRGTMYDSVTTMNPGGGIQAGSQPGTYTVIVRQGGFREFVQDRVRVASASCNQPETAILDVVLQPQ